MATKQDQAGAFRKYVVEFIGSFFLVMTICMAEAGGLGHFAAWATGCMLAGMFYSGFHISGAHFNPAISIASYLRGKLVSGDVLPYIVSQCLGGTLAAMLSGFMLLSMGTAEATPKELGIIPALIAELLGTLVMVYVYLNLTTAKKTTGHPIGGLAIALTYTALIYTFGAVSGGAFNPAVALGLTMANITPWESIWIFAVANFGGGALAAFLSQYVNGPEV